MAMPTYEDVMLPLLEVLSDGREWEMKDVVAAVADRLNLSDEDRAERITSGHPKIAHRVA
jgi:restriction system protein